MGSRILFFIWSCSFVFLFLYSFGMWIRDRFRLSQRSEQRKRAFLWFEIFQSMESAVAPPPSQEEIRWVLDRYWEENRLLFLCGRLKDSEETTLSNMKRIGEELAYRIANRRNSDT